MTMQTVIMRMVALPVYVKQAIKEVVSSAQVSCIYSGIVLLF